MAGINNSYPFEIRDIDPTQLNQLKEYFGESLFNLCATRYGPEGYLFSRDFESIGKEIYNMEIRPTDTFVVTFPKTGTTWTQELVWLIGNNFDYAKAEVTPLNIRYPFIESSMLASKEVLELLATDEKLKTTFDGIMPSIEQVNSIPSPRFIKTHLPLSLLPPTLLDTCKVVYVAREPKDVAVSFFHHKKMMNLCPDNRDFKRYWNFFIKDLIPWTPFFEHIKEAWQQRQHPNMLFLFYEELSKDLPDCARRVAKFLNKETTDEQIQKLCEHLNFDNFKNNKSVNMENMKQTGLFNEKENFIRKGKVGGWRNYFDEEMTQQAEQWMEENLRDTDLRFPQ